MSADGGQLFSHHAVPRDDTPPSRDEARDVTDGQGDPMVMSLRRRLKELDTQLLEERAKHARDLKAAEVKAERLRAWLVVIRLTCKGSAIGLAQQAIHSTDWPIGRRLPSERTIATEDENESEEP